MIGNGHCDDVCYTEECNWDNLDCGCAPGCRYEELAGCKPGCLVIECGYGAIEGYPPCIDISIRMTHMFTTLYFFRIQSIFPIKESLLCSPDIASQAYFTCKESLLENIICVHGFGSCVSPTDTCERVIPEGCLQCVAGLVNSAGVCQIQCAPGLLPHPIVPDFCIPADSTSPTNPAVYYIDSDYEGSERDGSQAKPFNSLKEGKAHCSYSHAKLLLTGAKHSFGELGVETYLPLTYVWEKEITKHQFSISISPLACETDPSCDRIRVLVLGQLSLYQYGLCRDRDKSRLLKLTNLIFEEHPNAFQTNVWLTCFVHSERASLEFTNVTFSGFHNAKYMVKTSPSIHITLRNVDFLNVQPIVAFFGTLGSEISICDNYLQVPSNFTYDTGSIIFNSPLSSSFAFISHIYMQSVLISNITLTGVDAGQFQFSFIEANSWVLLEISNSVITDNMIGSGYFIKVMSTKWSNTETFINVLDAVAHININISNCVFRNNTCTSKALMSFTYQALMQNVVLQNLSFDREIGGLISISSIVSAIKHKQGLAFLDPRTNRKVISPPSLITLQQVTISNCTSPTDGLFSLNQLPYVVISYVTVLWGGEELSTCAPVLLSDSLYSLHLSDSSFTGFKCSQGISGFAITNSISIVTIRRCNLTSDPASSSSAIAISVSTLAVLEDVRVQYFTSISSGAVTVSGFSTASLHLVNVVLEGNKGSNGGALYLSNLAESDISHSFFFNNSAVNGGAIAVHANLPKSMNLTITECLFQSNQASAQGGAIHVFLEAPASLLFFCIENTVLERNIGRVASGLYLSSMIQLLPSSALSNVTIVNNVADSQGALSLNYLSGALPLSSFSFVNNTGQIGESCLYVSLGPSGLVSLFNTTFEGNSGTYTIRSAFGLTFTLSNILLQRNSGASLYLESTQLKCYICKFRLNVGSGITLTTGSTASLQFAVFESNRLSGSGAAVQVSDLTSFICEYCLFLNNTATDKGGTLQSEGHSVVRLFHSRFERNNVAGEGSALTLIAARSVLIDNCTFTGNQAARGGTLFLTSATLIMRNCLLINNTAALRSAGLLINQSNVTLSGCDLAKQAGSAGYFMTITTLSTVHLENTTLREGDNADIGAVYIEESSLFLSYCQVSGLSGNKGTLIYAFGFAKVVVEHTTISHCQSTLNELIYLLLSSGTFTSSSFSRYSGSAVTAQESSLSLSNTSFSYASSGTGTGLRCLQCVFLQISDCLFEKLEADKGAALVIEGKAQFSSWLQLNNSRFRDNVARNAGAIYVLNSYVNITQSEFVGNRANETSGGAIVFSCSDLLLNCSYSVNYTKFMNNSAAVRGGAIAWNALQPQLTTLTFLSNTALYGPDYSSFPTHISTNNISLTHAASGQTFPGPLVFYLLDHYEQVVSDDNETKAALQVSGFKAKISGKTDTTARFGILTFSDFNISATPGSKPKVTVTVHDLNNTLDLLVFMRQCKLGESQTEDMCIPCEAGKYWIGPAQPCADCPSAAECLGGDRVNPRPGYWRSSESSILFWKCPNSESCLGVNHSAGSCAEGYEGNMCQTCSLNFHRSGKIWCEKCPSFNSSIASSIGFCIAVVLFFLIIVTTTIKSAYKPRALRSVYLKVLMNYLQLVMLMGSFNLSWPTLTKRLLDIQDSAGGFSERLFNADCLTDNYDENDAFFTKVVIMSAVPLICFSISSLCWVIIAVLKRSLSYLNKELVASGIILFFLVHPCVLRVMLTVFSCEEIQPDESWVASLQIRCWEGKYFTYALGVALPALIIWGIGVPAVILGTLVVQRKRLFDNSVIMRYGYLFKGYSASKFYWEFIIIYRKLLIIVISTFLSRTSKMTQALLVLSILLLFLLLHHHSSPYSHPYLNTMEHRSLLVSIATIFFGLFYLDGSLQVVTEYLCFALILLFNLYFLYYWAARVLNTCFVLLVKRFPLLQQHYIVIDETTAITHVNFRRTILPRNERFERPSWQLSAFMKRLYMCKIQQQ